MHLHLQSLDASYVRCIDKGPHVPMKAGNQVLIQMEQLAADKFVPKVASEYTKEDEKEVHEG